MDRNVALAFLLSLLVFTTWLIWQAEMQPSRTPVEMQAGDDSTQPEQRVDDDVVENPQLTTEVAREPSPPPEASPVDVVPLADVPAVADWTRTYRSARAEVTLSNRGAGLTSWKLADYLERGPDGEHPIELIRTSSHGPALQTPFDELGYGDLGEAVFEVESETDDGVTFVLRRPGATIRKIFDLQADMYEFRLTLEITNDGDRPISPRFAVLWPAVVDEHQDFKELSLVALHADGVERQAVATVGSPGFFDRFFGSGGEGPSVYRGGIDWAGVDMKYFVSVLLPARARSSEASFEPLERGKSAMTVLAFEPVSLAPGQAIQQEYHGYIGPKEPARLEAVGSELSKSINLGYRWITPLTAFFVWLLHASYTIIPNYGVAIILITILVRVATLPIMSRQMKSMEKMRELQPRLKEIQAKYADDRAKQSEETMKMYRESGVNPLGGCLPMLLQFPVFIGLFFALQSSIDLRHAPFVFWINDLSSPESLFVIPGLGIDFRLLPILMGASMIVQQRLQPMTLDPAQAKMMLWMMPGMMTVLFYRFPSGLVLYWMVSNLLGIGHQVWVGRSMKKGQA